MYMLGVYNYTVILTYVAMLVSFAGIHLTFTGHLNEAFICLMASAVMDMFDGKVAATKKNRTDFEKLFGIQIDSMSDIICYGVLPALMVYHLGASHKLPIVISAVYLLCALIRLCYFNCDEMERQKVTDDCRHEYKGLPVTTIALILPLVHIFCLYTRFDMEINYLIPTVVLAGVGICFITPFKLIKPGMKGKLGLIAMGLTELFLLFWSEAHAL